MTEPKQAHLIRIPKASENMEAATVARWLKAEGDAVAEGDPIAELVTDKADFEYESDAGGTLLQIVAPEKSLVPVGYVIAILGEPGTPLPDVSRENAALMEMMREAVAPTAIEGTSAGAAPGTTGRRVAAKPGARRLARQHDLDLAAVADALSKKGPLTEEDIQRYLEARG